METLNTSEQFGMHWDMSSSALPWNSGPLVPVFQSGTDPLGLNTRQGFQNPSYKSQIRAGVNATTPFVGTRIDGDPSFCSSYSIGRMFNNSGRLVGEWNYVCAGFVRYPVKPQAIMVPSSVVTDVNNRCIAKFIDEANAAMSSENLTGRSIKHFRHDIHSTIHPMTAIRDKISSYLTSLEKVKYGKLKGPSLLNAVSASYLEFKFGVQPFVQDITDILTDLVIKDRKRTPTVEIEGTASSTFNGLVVDSSPWVNDGYMTPFSPVQSYRNTSIYSCRMKGAMRTDTGMDGRVGFIQDNRLLPSDWAPTIFSILPYAWMVNYFSNVRNIIDGISFRFSNLAWGCQTTRVTNQITYTGMRFTNQQPFDSATFHSTFANVISGGAATLTWRKVTRTGITPGDLVPRIEFTIPSTPTPWLNMMAAFLPRIVKIVF